MATLKINIGEDAGLRFTLTDSGTAVDLTGGSLKMKIAKNILTPDNEALFLDTFTTFTDAVNGIHDETIAKETTATWEAGNYIYQCQFTDGSGIVKNEDVKPVIIIDTLFV